MSLLNVRFENHEDTQKVFFRLRLLKHVHRTVTEALSEVYSIFQNTASIRFRAEWANGVTKFYTQIKALCGVRLLYALTDIHIINSWNVLCDLGDTHIMLRTDLNSWQLLYNCPHDTVAVVKLLFIITDPRNRIPFRKLYEDTNFTDFELFAENNNEEKVSVHRNVLAVSSPVLKAMLLGDWQEAKQGHVQPPGVSKTTLQQFKDYVYLKKLPNKPLDYAKLVILASYYMLNDLADLVRDGGNKIVKRINPENIWEWFEICIQHKNAKLLLLPLRDNICETVHHLQKHHENTSEVRCQINNETSNEYYLYEDTDFTDFKLRVESEDGVVPVHRNVLAVYSPVLEKMFLDDWKETTEGYVQIPNISIVTLQQFKDYVYLKKVPEDIVDCIKLLSLATHFMMAELEVNAAKNIADTFKPENAWDLFEYCMEYKSDYLLRAILKNIYDEDKLEPLEEYFAKL